jgi:hypothetical protein
MHLVRTCIRILQPITLLHIAAVLVSLIVSLESMTLSLTLWCTICNDVLAIYATAEDANGELYMVAWGQKPGLDTVYHLPCGRLCNTITPPTTPGDANGKCIA